MEKKLLFKDDKLNYVIESNLGNIAQFISFSPYEKDMPRYVHVSKYSYSDACDEKTLIEILIAASTYKAVNIRSFSPEVMKGNKFIYNKKIEKIIEQQPIEKEYFNDYDKKYDKKSLL